jgi:hypothetical protein
MNGNSDLTPEEEREFAELSKPIIRSRVAVVIVTGILVLWVIPAVIIWKSGKEWTVDKVGQFGDSFGVVNALFSAIAFGGIIYTILQQRRELRLQSFELRMTRKELKRTAEAQEKSEHALRMQADSLLLAAQLNALVARINVYDQQIADRQREREKHGVPVNEPENPVERMKRERYSLYLELDELRQRSIGLGKEAVPVNRDQIPRTTSLAGDHRAPLASTP